MTDKHPSAPARPASGRSTGGVEHVNVPHTENFTVVGNHLAQHPDLSLTAIGLAVHIQSLPAGSQVGIKTLAGKFPEGEIRIAAALRELEEHGYLARTKERLQSGRVTTRTVSFNRPRGSAVATAAVPATVVPEVPVPSADAPTVVASTAYAPVSDAREALAPAAREEPDPAAPAPQGHRKAAALLTRLGLDEPRLVLTERDVRRLAPAVSAWLERGVPATAVERALTAGLPPEPIRRPAAFLHHRLTADLPPPPPTAPPTAPAGIRPDPLQTCDGCERAFRAPAPGRCRDCRATERGAA
ncbi:helix-turn-helix domain-containing protein [Streptomyces sp. HMX87]|uniref:helix-turn-helix domain-containing protein n=1 Tax=Streptomyces sp. HMX87 TaxID=3390849 RepID=UPI003A8A48FF